MSANERRAEIIRILEGRRQEKIANLAFQLKVSIRTIKYDIEILAAEYPLETIRGNGGCVRLLQGYHSYQNDISDEQQKLLMSLIPTLDGHSGKVIQELLRSHGSIRNKPIIEGAI